MPIWTNFSVPAPASLLDQVQPHRHVREEEAARVVPVGADAADLRGQVDDGIGATVVVGACDGRRVGQVVLGAAGYEDLGGPGSLEPFTDFRAQEPCSPGQKNPLVPNAVGHYHDRLQITITTLATT